MPTHETLTDQWLATVLSEMGDCHEQVAKTLRKAQITGRRGDAYDCPIARYIASRAGEHVSSDAVTVHVCGDITVTIGDDFEVITPMPEPVSEFVAIFDEAESARDLYADLVESSSS